jgi:mRNA-degrading endonuclease toxin of MazEF toxin-antitoxin module
MNRWEVWILKQDEARNETDPKQPNDASKPRRYFVVVSPDAFLSTSEVAVVIPIQTVSDGTSFSVRVHGKPSTASIPYDSYARATDYYTLKKSLFSKRIGRLTKAETQSLEFATREYFQLF